MAEPEPRCESPSLKHARLLDALEANPDVSPSLLYHEAGLSPTFFRLDAYDTPKQTSVGEKRKHPTDPTFEEIMAGLQNEWTALRNASIKRGKLRVPGTGKVRAALAERELNVCTVCDTVKAVEEMTDHRCTSCTSNRAQATYYRNTLHRRVAEARAALYEQHRDDSAIGSRFEKWLAKKLREAGFIVELNYEFCRTDLLLKLHEDDTEWYRIQCKGSECNRATFANMFGYGSRAGGVEEPDHRMLVVCGHKDKDGDAYMLWALDGGKIPMINLAVSKAGVLAEESLNLSPTALKALVARIHDDLKKGAYPLTTADAAELDISSLRQLKEKALTLALCQSGVCQVEYPRGNQSCIDCSTIIDDDRWIATQVKTFNFMDGLANAYCSVNRAHWPYPHNCAGARL